MTSPQTRQAAAVSWATNALYPSRVHMINGRGRVSLCGFPITAVTHDRPGRLRICPDCAMAYVDASFPTDNTGRAGSGSVEWFRRLPTTEQNPGLEHRASDTIKPQET